MNLHRWYELTPGTIKALPVQKRRRGNQGTRSTRKLYKDIICAFDTETTRLDKTVDPCFGHAEQRYGKTVETGRNEQAIMYIWQFAIGPEDCYIGRTWDEFQKFIDILRADLQKDERIVVWVHNLSYEFQFLRGLYAFQSNEVFALDNRKVLKCTMYQSLEFRCSMLHSNLSLADYTQRYNVTHGKTTMDYSIKRYPWTPLTSAELEYCANDVIGLVEALTIEMESDGDNLYTVPLTSTGYVRRDVKRAMHTPRIARLIHDIYPNVNVYRLLRSAFAGGDTHANRFLAGEVLDDVHSMDRSSSYPDVLVNNQFPVGKWWEFDSLTQDEFSYLAYKRNRAMVFTVSVKGLRLRNRFDGHPIISKSHCTDIHGSIVDNGRIIRAETLTTVITDIDWDLINDQYTIDEWTIGPGAYARYGMLPDELRSVICDYYHKKTALKGVEGQEVYYMRAKQQINSCYGMAATDPGKPGILFEGDFTTDGIDLETKILQAHKKAFITYAWGVWTTAWARWHLYQGIKAVEKSGGRFVYCDTDSVKYIGECDIEKYNRERREASIRSGAWANDPKGHPHYMGEFEFEGTYHKFATLGAKKYAFVMAPGEPVQVTIAGVNKLLGGPELEKGDEFGQGIERFCQLEPPFTFYEAGGTEAVYQDNPAITSIEIEGHTLPITANVVIRPSTYTLGITAEYESLLRTGRIQYQDYILGGHKNGIL